MNISCDGYKYKSKSQRASDELKNRITKYVYNYYYRIVPYV